MLFLYLFIFIYLLFIFILLSYNTFQPVSYTSTPASPSPPNLSPKSSPPPFIFRKQQASQQYSTKHGIIGYNSIRHKVLQNTKVTTKTYLEMTLLDLCRLSDHCFIPCEPLWALFIDSWGCLLLIFPINLAHSSGKVSSSLWLPWGSPSSDRRNSMEITNLHSMST